MCVQTGRDPPLARPHVVAEIGSIGTAFAQYLQ
jgi:hypothetical protein